MLLCNGGMYKKSGSKNGNPPGLDITRPGGYNKYKDRALPANGRPLPLLLKKK